MFDAPDSLDMPSRKSSTSKPSKPVMEQVNVRVPPDLLEVLADAHRVEVLLAQKEHTDPPDMASSLRRMWRIGADVIFHKVNGRPRTEAEWQALEASLLAAQKH